MCWPRWGVPLGVPGRLDLLDDLSQSQRGFTKFGHPFTPLFNIPALQPLEAVAEGQRHDTLLGPVEVAVHNIHGELGQTWFTPAQPAMA